MNVVAILFFTNQSLASAPAVLRDWILDLWLRVGLVFLIVSFTVVGVLALAYLLGATLSDAIGWIVYVRMKRRYDKSLFILEDRYLWKFLARPIPLAIMVFSAVVGIMILPSSGAVGTIQVITFPIMVLAGVGLYYSLLRASKELGIRLSRSYALSQLSASSEVVATFWEIVIFGALLVEAVPPTVGSAFSLSLSNLPAGIPSPAADPALLSIISANATGAIQQFREVIFSVVAVFLASIALYLYVIPTLLESSSTRLKLYRLALPLVAFVASFLSEEALLVLVGLQIEASPFALTSTILISIVATLLGTSYERMLEPPK